MQLCRVGFMMIVIHIKLINTETKVDGKYSERVQLPAKAIADCHHNGGARLMEQPLPQC